MSEQTPEQQHENPSQQEAGPFNVDSNVSAPHPAGNPVVEEGAGSKQWTNAEKLANDMAAGHGDAAPPETEQPPPEGEPEHKAE
jgi:hypothetical protein